MMASSQSSSPPPRYQTGKYFKRLYTSGKEKRENYEVLFPNFTVNHPWEKTPDEAEEEDREPTSQLRNISVPIHTLSHVTHNDEAESIENERGDKYHFEARRKCGKDFREGHYLSWIRKDSSMNEVQVNEQSASDGLGREYKYKKVNKEDELLPGFYSWWGIRPSEHDLSLALSQPERATLRAEKVSVANYISRPQSSNYGNNCFYSSYEDALESYATSRETVTSQLCFKVGGTLRYRHEICHVVIVCRQDDTALSSYAAIQDDTALSSYAAIQDDTSYAPIKLARVLRLKKKGSGIVKNEAHCFQPQYVITKIKDKNVSYENLAFAFYFPTKSFLRCQKKSVRRCPIAHTETQCTKTIRVPGKPNQCPNKINQKKTKNPLQVTNYYCPSKGTKKILMPIPAERQKLKFPRKKRQKNVYNVHVPSTISYLNS